MLRSGKHLYSCLFGFIMIILAVNAEVNVLCSGSKGPGNRRDARCAQLAVGSGYGRSSLGVHLHKPRACS